MADPTRAEPYVLHVDDRGHKLTIHPLVIGAHGPVVVVTAPDGVPVPTTLVGDVARALLAAAGLGQLIVPSPDWPAGRDEVEHRTGIRIKVTRDTVDVTPLIGLGWEDALSLASHLAYAAYRAREYEEAAPSPAVREIAALVEEVEPDLREAYAQDAPEAIARALLAAGYVKAGEAPVGGAR